MTLKKHQIYIHINSKEELLKAKEILKRNNEQISDDFDDYEPLFPCLKLFALEPIWFTQTEEVVYLNRLEKIELDQLEEVIKNSSV